ncbi:translation initiation factor IF-3, partial [Streptococcus pneumoniae]
MRASNLRVIDQDGKQIGVISKIDALGMARDQGLDLV